MNFSEFRFFMRTVAAVVRGFLLYPNGFRLSGPANLCTSTVTEIAQTCASGMRTVPVVLSTSKIRTGSWRYYANQVERGACEYFLGLGEAPGRWYGRGLDQLDLSPGARVAERELEGMFGRALHPGSGERLGRGWRADGVTGYDLTFSAPKSVSTLWALAGDDASVARAVRQAHAAAVRTALDYLDGRAAFSRTGRDGHTQVGSDGFAVAVFDHRTSRAGDPQLHTHALVLNKVRTADGGWRTVDGHEIYAHKKSAGALYQAALRNELTRTLGVSWTGVSKDGQAEIAGVPAELMQAWSKRSAQTLREAAPVIQAYERRLGRALTSAERVAVEKVAVLKTRPHKTGVDIPTLLQRWAGEAERLGWTPERLEAAGGEARSLSLDPGGTVVGLDRLLQDAVTAAGDRRAIFSRSDLAVEVAARLPAVGFTADVTRELVERFTANALSLSEAVRLHDDTDGPTRTSDARYASRTTLTRELQILETAEEGRFADVAVCTPHTVHGAVRGRGLDRAQMAAVMRLCSDGSTVSVLVAPAGTGKTCTIGAAVQAWRSDGHRVVGFAPSARAAKELATATGLPADTVAKFLHEQPRQQTSVDADPRYRVGRGSVVVVDEASMLSTADLHQLTHVVRNAGGKLVLVGDPAQIGAIDQAGGMLPALAHHLQAPTLDHVHRFREPWERFASLQLRAGNPNGIQPYLDHDRIHTAETDSDAVDALFRHYTQLTGEAGRVLMLARSHSDVDDLNSRARHHAITTSEVHGPPLLTAGDREWRIGDQLRVTRNDRRIPVGTDHLRNGDSFTVTGHTSTGLTVQRLDSTDTAVLPDRYVAEHARYGWASTIASAQGATVDHALLLARPGLDRSNLYVGLTRGRDTNHIYLAPEPEPEIKIARDTRQARDPASQLQAMLATAGDHTAAHTRLSRPALDRAGPESQPMRDPRGPWSAARATTPARPRSRGYDHPRDYYRHQQQARGYSRGR